MARLERGLIAVGMLLAVVLPTVLHGWPTTWQAAVPLDAWVPDPGLAVFSAGFAVLALAWSGRTAWLVGLCGAVYLVVFDRLSGMDDWVVAMILALPAYLAGTALRLRQETAEQLMLSARELEEERELFAEVAVRHERARLASELHDVVGHAVSVMVSRRPPGSGWSTPTGPGPGSVPGDLGVRPRGHQGRRAPSRAAQRQRRRRG